MAFEFLDLENKMYIPTQQLLNQFRKDLVGLPGTIRENLIQLHHEAAVLGREFYAAPLDTLTRWYDQAVIYGTELYAGFFENIIPQVEANYQEIASMTTDWVGRTRDNINYMVENPQQITTEAIQTMTENLTAVGNLSKEMVEELQDKTAEIIALLLDHPWQTLESGAMDLLANLLDGYFELVSSLLATM
ncbi:hypothetical protein [Methylomarinum vadi]|uniref:hypothetical protein n=1 Tax=Methylomarinum vadi TaxID=438855 RepID=UPI0004DF3ABD|nr:hypothetical protein [Methylomarinum vadi]